MPVDLGRRLIAAGVAPPEEIEAALFVSVVRGISFPRALIDRGVVTERTLEDELARRGGLALRNVIGAPDLVARLPRAICRRLAAIPTRLDPLTGTVDVAAADPLDPHVAAELGFHLGMPVRVLRASLAAVEEAIRRIELDETQAAPPAPRPRRATPAFPHGAPSSSPPPPADDVPIPLVRRVGVPLVDPEPDDSASTRRRGASSDRDAVPPPAVSFPSTPPPPDDAAPEPERLPPLHRPSIPPGVVTAWPSLAPEPEPAPPPLPPRAPKLPGQIIDAPGPPPLPFQDPSAVVALLRKAYGRDDVVRLSLRAMRLVARRVGLFVVRKDGFHGWACNVELGDEEAFRTLAIPHEVPSVLATATATGMYLGPIPSTPAHSPLLAVLGSASRDVAVAVVRAGGRPAMLLVADDLGDTLDGTRSLEEIARAAGEALTRLIKG